MHRESSPTPKWASWIQNWCGSWHLEAPVADASKQLEVGMLVVKFPDGTLHPGVVDPTTGVMMAGGYGFQADDLNGKKCLEVISPSPIQTRVNPGPGEDLPTEPCIIVPTEGEVYEEDDEIP